MNEMTKKQAIKKVEQLDGKSRDLWRHIRRRGPKPTRHPTGYPPRYWAERAVAAAIYMGETIVSKSSLTIWSGTSTLYAPRWPSEPAKGGVRTLLSGRNGRAANGCPTHPGPLVGRPAASFGSGGRTGTCFGWLRRPIWRASRRFTGRAVDLMRG